MKMIQGKSRWLGLVVFHLILTGVVATAFQSPAHLVGQEISATQFKAEIDEAETAFKNQDLAEAAVNINQAIGVLEGLLKATPRASVSDIRSQHKRLVMAHRLLKSKRQTLAALPRLKFNYVEATEAGAEMNATAVLFTKNVAPILAEKCGRCHISRRSGDVSLASVSQMIGLISGGDSSASQLYTVIEDDSMPKGNNKLTAEEKSAVKTWIDQGAKLDGGQLDFDLRPLMQMAAGPVVPAGPITPASDQDTVFFSKDIAPLLAESCNGCHINANNLRGGLSLDSFARMLRGGDSGSIIVPGNPEVSLLVSKLKGMGDGQRMPINRPMWSDEKIQLISTWIKEGAHFDATDPNQPMISLATLSSILAMDAQQLGKHRQEVSIQQWKLALVDQDFRESQSEHFNIIAGYGLGSGRMDNILKSAEKEYAKLENSLLGDKKSVYAEGKIAIFVPNSAYDYSEFGKMLEKRETPFDQRSHWAKTVDGPYLVWTASLSQEQLDAALPNLLAPAMVANLAPDLPDWFCVSLGLSALELSRSQVESLQANLRGNPPGDSVVKSWIEGTLEPTAKQPLDFAASLGWRKSTTQLKAIRQNLVEGKSLDQTILQLDGLTTPQFAQQLLQLGAR